MKFTATSLLAALALGTSAMAQSIEFLSPLNGASVPVGQNFTVQIGQPMELSGFTNAAISFGYEACRSVDDSVTCPNVAAPNQGVGDVLETFVFHPQLSHGPTPPNQNFSISLPSYATGESVLSATLFYFGSAALAPMFIVANITVNAA